MFVKLCCNSVNSVVILVWAVMHGHCMTSHHLIMIDHDRFKTCTPSVLCTMIRFVIPSFLVNFCRWVKFGLDGFHIALAAAVDSL